LLSGAFAIAVRKGSRLHRASGNIFTVAMLTLASSALCLAIMKSQHGNIIGSIITFYMIATAWLAGRRRGIGRLDLAALLVDRKEVTGSCENFDTGEESTFYPAVIGFCPTALRQG
jgi:uncharacterized membrane protein